MSEQQAVAGMAWRDIAASAYRAYAAVTGGKNYQGLPMPTFEALPPLIAAAWEAAARQVGECQDVPMGSGAPAEAHWAEWRPPAFVERLLVPVESSNVAAVGYDPGAERLYVAFKGGGVYQYFAVTPEEHAALMAAESKGAYLARHIKPLHTASKLPAAEEAKEGEVLPAGAYEAGVEATVREGVARHLQNLERAAFFGLPPEVTP